MDFKIGTLLINKKSKSLAVVVRKLPLVEEEALDAVQMPQLFSRDAYTEQQLKDVRLRGMCIRTDTYHDDKWDDDCFIIERLTVTDESSQGRRQLPYNGKRLSWDWEVLSE